MSYKRSYRQASRTKSDQIDIIAVNAQDQVDSLKGNFLTRLLNIIPGVNFDRDGDGKISQAEYDDAIAQRDNYVSELQALSDYLIKLEGQFNQAMTDLGAAHGDIAEILNYGFWMIRKIAPSVWNEEREQLSAFHAENIAPAEAILVQPYEDMQNTSDEVADALVELAQAAITYIDDVVDMYADQGFKSLTSPFKAHRKKFTDFIERNNR